MGVVLNRVLAIDESVRYIEKYLVAMSFQKALGETQHVLRWRRPTATTLMNYRLLLGRKLFICGESVKERMIRPHLKSSSQYPQPTTRLEELLVRIGQAYAEQ